MALSVVCVGQLPVPSQQKSGPWRLPHPWNPNAGYLTLFPPHFVSSTLPSLQPCFQKQSLELIDSEKLNVSLFQAEVILIE
jgi:hypothetical protein